MTPSSSVLTCPFCQGQALQRWGPLVRHRRAVVAGQPIVTSARPFSLWRCQRCHFAQKWPQPSAAELHEAYAGSTERSEAGSDASARPLWTQLERLAQRYSPTNRVLDVGCSNGDLLASWAGSWLRHGVEPSAQAAATATRRGVAVVGRTVEDLNREQQFGCIVSVDVAEHIAAPLAWLQRLAQHLSPGGVLLVSTGCTDAIFWRLSRARYWYAGFGEHISFFGRDSFRRFASATGLIWQGTQHHPHQANQPGLTLFGQMTKAVVCQLCGPLWGPRSHATLTAYPDHQLVVLQRPTSNLDGR